MKKRVLICFSLIFILMGCSSVPLIPTEFVENTTSAYQSWTIRGKAKKFKSDAENNMLYYAAQSAWENGYNYFIVEDMETRSDYSGGEYGIGSYYQSRATILMFNDFEVLPSQYDSYYITKECFSKYDAEEENKAIKKENSEDALLYGTLGALSVGSIIALIIMLTTL